MSLQLTESQLLLRRTVRDFAEKEIAPKALELDEHEEFPFDIFEGLRELGLTGIGINPEYGGSGGGVTEGLVAMEEICRAYAGIGTILAVQFGLWGQLVQQFGNDEQRRAFLTPLTQGGMITAFALTEPDAGSDAAALQTRAERRGGEYVLNGAKTFITCGDVATHLLLIATMDPSLRHKGVTCFVVPAKPKVSPRTSSLGSWASAPRPPPRCFWRMCAFPSSTASAKNAAASPSSWRFLKHRG